MMNDENLDNFMLDEELEDNEDSLGLAGEGISYKGYIIDHLSMNVKLGDDEKGNLDIYTILSNTYYLTQKDTGKKIFMNLRCLDEDGNIINFNSFDQAKQYIDKYMSQNKGHEEVRGKDLYYVLDESISTEESDDSKEHLSEAINHKNRLIYDLCTPTMERRDTTPEDIENDIRVFDYNSPEELYDDLLEISYWDDDEVAEESDSDDVFDKIDFILKCMNDPGDGSPNILYCCVDGIESNNTLPYDCLSDLDLATCSEDDIMDILIGEGDFEDNYYFDDDDELELY